MGINFALLIAIFQHDMLKSRRKSVIYFDILTFLHAIAFMIQTKTSGAGFEANI